MKDYNKITKSNDEVSGNDAVENVTADVRENWSEAYVTCPLLNVRADADGDAAVIGVLKNGTIVDAAYKDVNWAHIKCKELDGYVMKIYLSELKLNTGVI